MSMGCNLSGAPQRQAGTDKPGKKKKKDVSDLFRLPIRIKNISRNTINCPHRSSCGLSGLMENAYKGKKKFGAADLHVTEPTPVCYLFVSPR